MSDKAVKFPKGAKAFDPSILRNMIEDMVRAQYRAKQHLKDINHELASLIIKYHEHSGGAE